MGLDTIVREMGLAARQARQELRVAVGAPESTEARLGLLLQPGARVLDLVTGQEGVVSGGTRANTVVPTAGR